MLGYIMTVVGFFGMWAFLAWYLNTEIEEAWEQGFDCGWIAALEISDDEMDIVLDSTED